MRLTYLLPALVFSVVSPPPVSAIDLTKIERTIAKEPAYRNQPKYCLLVFGPEAKFRVWLVLDGDVLYVDRNGNGDLTEAGERMEKGRNFRSVGPTFYAGDIAEPGGKVRHTDLRVDASDGYVEITVAGKRMYTSKEQGVLAFSSRPQDAPIIHFNGTLTFGLVPRGREAAALDHIVVEIGTPGLGKGTFAAIELETVPDRLAPSAEVELPNKNPEGKPLKVKTVLPNRV
jgi:hypothetical protein